MEQDALETCACAHANMSSLIWALDQAYVEVGWNHDSIQVGPDVIEFRRPMLRLLQF